MISPQRTGFTKRPMAGYQQADRVPTDCSTDGADGLWMSNRPGDLGIGSDVARWDLQKRLPDFDLERRADHVQRGVALPAERCSGPVVQRFGVLYKGCLRPTRRQIGHRDLLARLSRKGETAQTRICPHCQCRAEGAVEPAPADHQTRTAARIIARGHRLPSDEKIVQPAGARQANSIGGSQRGKTITKKMAGMVQRQILLVSFG